MWEKKGSLHALRPPWGSGGGGGGGEREEEEEGRESR